MATSSFGFQTPDLLSPASVSIIIILSVGIIILLIVVIILTVIIFRIKNKNRRMKKEEARLFGKIDQLTLALCNPPVIPELGDHEQPPVQSLYLTVPGQSVAEYETIPHERETKERQYESIGLQKEMGKHQEDEGSSSSEPHEGHENQKMAD